jgi:hypothetical protein
MEQITEPRNKSIYSHYMLKVKYPPKAMMLKTCGQQFVVLSGDGTQCKEVMFWWTKISKTRIQNTSFLLLRCLSQVFYH